MTTSSEISAPSLGEGHVEPLKGLDIFMGGFCVISFLTSIVAWNLGYTSTASPISIALFLITNLLISQISFRSHAPYKVEIGRAIAGAIIAPGTFLLVDGWMTGWWPGFLIMCLGGCIILGLLTQKPFFGALLVFYYSVLFFLTAYFGNNSTSTYQLAMNIAVIAMVGLTFSQTMSLLGQSLHKEYLQRIELKKTKDALFAEMAVAQEIQTLLLPRSPTLPYALVTGKMVPATEVGGDYYDVIKTPSGRHFIAIGDVSGHGVTSGLTMMMARASLVGALESLPNANLATIYQIVNQCLMDNLERMALDLYMTFALIEYEPGGIFRSVGKHLPFFIYRRNENRIDEIELRGTWLGIIEKLPQEKLPEIEFSLREGDRLFLYTDGSVEHFNNNNSEMFGSHRLHDLILNGKSDSAATLIENILTSLRDHSPVFEDDVTFLVVDMGTA